MLQAPSTWVPRHLRSIYVVQTEASYANHHKWERDASVSLPSDRQGARDEPGSTRMQNAFQSFCVLPINSPTTIPQPDALRRISRHAADVSDVVKTSSIIKIPSPLETFV